MRAFASDNYAPVLPEALAAIAEANHGHAISYGADEVTARLQALVRAEFGDAATAFPVFNGTGANVVSLRALLRPWQGVICAETAHLNVDECGAPEALGGVKLLTVPTPDGKLTPELMERRIVRVGDEHVVQAGVGVDHAVDRARHAVHARGGRGDRWRAPARTGWPCTSTARGWPTPPRRSAARCARSRATRARTSCPSAARRSGCWAPRP